MSNTSNFDYCVELGLAPLKAIFHLALKNEELFPHNIGPLARNFGGHAATIMVKLLDDEDSPADLSLQDAHHILFALPIEIDVEVPDAPDPSLSRVTLKATVEAPGLLATWAVDGKDQLGIDFTGIAAADVNVPSVTGLPTLDVGRFQSAIHTRYESLPTHSFPLGGNTLNLYDGTRDTTLIPPNSSGNPEITVTLENHGADQYLKIDFPIHADVQVPITFASYGTATAWRKVVQAGGTVSIDMAVEPGDTALATQVVFDSSHPAAGPVAAQLKPLLIARLADFGVVSEPWFDESAAKSMIAAETATYLTGRRYPYYTPESGDDETPLETPVGFLLPSDGVLAILMNRRDSSVADTAPDAFLGANQVALAVSRALLDETITRAMNDEFPGVNDGGAEVSTDEGDATLKTLSVTPSDPGAHGVSEGHLWISGEAEVHIDCWPDPDVSFSGPMYLRVHLEETDESCNMTIGPEMGDFDAGQSCCDVFVDLIIPVVGWIMLGVIESMIDRVGGELAATTADAQARNVNAIPPVVAGVAELQACLESVLTSSQGLVFPGKLRIRREGRSFEDLAESGDLPRP
jgi:hypothetical protein